MATKFQDNGAGYMLAVDYLRQAQEPIKVHEESEIVKQANEHFAKHGIPKRGTPGPRQAEAPQEPESVKETEIPGRPIIVGGAKKAKQKK